MLAGGGWRGRAAGCADGRDRDNDNGGGATDLRQTGTLAGMAADTEQMLTIPGRVSSPIAESSRAVRIAGFVVVVLALISVAVSFAILTGMAGIDVTTRVLQVTLSVNGVLLVALTGLIAWELVGLYIAWRDRRAAAGLHWRVISLFILIAAAPAIIIAVLASVTLDQGLDRWFETRTRTIVENAANVGDAYLQEHARALRADTIAMATDVDRAKELYEYEPARFDQFFEAQCSVRGIPAAFLLKSDGTIVTRTQLDPQWSDVLQPPPEALKQAMDKEEPVIIAPGVSNQVGAVMKLKDYDDMALYVTRPLDARILSQVRLSKEASADYNQLESSRLGTQLAFGLIFIGVSLIFLVAAIWIGIGFANQLVAPIRRLILAADYVSKGNLAVQVPVRQREGDLAHLAETFNTMTAELRSQRADLIDANEQIDLRRRFTEAVLAGVSAGVLGVDRNGRITLANRSAIALLDTGEANLLGKAAAEAVPELAQPIAEAMDDPSHRVRQAQVTIRRAGKERTVNVQITSEASPGGHSGLVVTFDDITDLVTAQRSSAWADVARRIAHEIKNPLTPIQLSAERIKRRYGKKVEDDRAVFDQCVDTIIRQVGDIERMVNEFSSFARMPKPQLERADVVEAVKESVFLLSVQEPDIEFVSNWPDEPIYGRYDHRLLRQAFTNIVKNATEAVSAVTSEERGAPGRIEVSVRREDTTIVVDVIDNGVGLPQENRHRLLEPYVTTREKGTGLGLAIVRKILEDHGGTIDLVDAPEVSNGGRGAMVRMTLPAADPPAGSPEPDPPVAAETNDDKTPSTHAVTEASSHGV